MGLIAGPCSVETFEQVLSIAKEAKAAGANLLRGGALSPEQAPILSRVSDSKGWKFSAL